MKNVSCCLFFIITLLCVCKQSTSQPFKRIAVIGSSTAWGYFVDPNPPNNPLYPRDSAWTFKIQKYYKDLNLIDTLYNLAVVGDDCYNGMPDSYTPPVTLPVRESPRTNFNITAAVQKIPKPDVIIVNYPSNHYDYLDISEILFCLQTIKDTANINNITCYIATTQPRDNFSDAERIKLKILRDSILNRFGTYAIDFFSDVAEEPDFKIQPEYALGDGVHLNPEGHNVLKQKVIDKNILFNILPVSLINFSAEKKEKSILLKWITSSEKNMLSYEIERSDNGINFYKIATKKSIGNSSVSQTYQFTDSLPGKGYNYYRLVSVDINNNKKISLVVSVYNNVRGISAGLLYPVPSTNKIYINFETEGAESLQIKIMDAAGKICKEQNTVVVKSKVYETDIRDLSPGKYFMIITSLYAKEIRQFIKQ